MKFKQLPIGGAFLVEPEPHLDVRGAFFRSWCAEEFAQAGLSASFVQASVSTNTLQGTLRGMHMQLPPSSEAKLVRCTRGAAFDVMLDMRPESPTFLQHCSVELHAELGNAVYIPARVAHGFQTLTDATDVYYQMTDSFSPGLSVGWRWNDPTFAIAWPDATARVIGERDAACADFDANVYFSLLTKHVGASATGQTSATGQISATGRKQQ